MAVGDHGCQVDRSQIARFIGEQRLLAAGIRRFDHPHVGRGIVAVETVEKHNPRFSVFPRLGDDAVEDLPGIVGTDFMTVPGVDEIIILIIFHGVHKGFGQADGEVEIVQLFLVGLAHDKIHDVRMIDPQDAHVGAPTGSALFDGFSGHVKNLHKRNRAAGNARRGQHNIIGRTEPGK